ncbi:MAG: hypothetical protein IPK53_11530 [bacterium]|nr:hypothetical protein [bacterium]
MHVGRDEQGDEKLAVEGVLDSVFQWYRVAFLLAGAEGEASQGDGAAFVGVLKFFLTLLSCVVQFDGKTGVAVAAETAVIFAFQFGIPMQVCKFRAAFVPGDIIGFD